MAIIEIKTVEEFRKAVEDLERNRFKLYITELKEAILRPQVTSKNVDTIYIRNLKEEEIKAVIKIWGGTTANIVRFWWSEDKQPGREYV
jgi:hypothetical protein